MNLAAGANHSLAVSASGELYSWGAGDQGCLGHGPPVKGRSWDEAAPRAVASLSNVGSAAASITHSGVQRVLFLVYAEGVYLAVTIQWRLGICWGSL